MDIEFIDCKTNNNLSQLRGYDLLELLEIIENLFIEYRNNLQLPPNITFGVEIEYERTNKTVVDEYIESNFPKWYSGYDPSLNSGGEIDSPILRDEKQCWKELKKYVYF